MQSPAMTISMATPASAGRISQLLEANSAARGGELFGDWSEPMVRRWLDDGMHAFIAEIGGEVIGVLMTSDCDYLTSPPALGMLEFVKGAAERFFAYGPVCIANEARGRGLLAALWTAAEKFYCDKRAILFVNQKNERSLAAHERLGMIRLKPFQASGQDFFALVSPLR
jgi:hypothetical protein